jgi:hypothetical protein
MGKGKALGESTLVDANVQARRFPGSYWIQTRALCAPDSGDAEKEKTPVAAS